MPTFNQSAKPLPLSLAARTTVSTGKAIAQPVSIAPMPAAATIASAQPGVAASPPPANPVNLPRIGSTVLATSSTRPLWFNGRFLAASDLRREQQHYFLQRQASYGQAAGSGILNGLTVEQPAAGSQFDTAETIVIRAGVGLTPSGQLVMLSSDLNIELSDLADEQNLDEQFGLAETPQQPQRTRTGVYIVALRLVEFTANPIAPYPSSLQTPRVTQDSDIVEATPVSVVPFGSVLRHVEPTYIALTDSTLPATTTTGKLTTTSPPVAIKPVAAVDPIAVNFPAVETLAPTTIPRNLALHDLTVRS